MSDMGVLSMRVYVDDPSQPSRPGLTNQATINVSNQQCLFFEGKYTVEKIVIHEPFTLGMRSGEQIDTHEFIKRVLMACNLLLEHMCLSINPSGTDIAVFAPAVKKPVGPTIKHGPDGPVITLPENIRGTMSVSITANATEELDESRMRDVLDMVYAVYDDKNPTMMVSKTRESLDSYHKGVRSPDRETVFKELYAALEKAVNFDRDDRCGEDLDKEVRKLAGDPNLPAKNIRLMNNRLKHGPRGKNLQPLDSVEICNRIRTLRPVVSRIILLRLGNVTGSIQKQIP